MDIRFAFHSISSLVYSIMYLITFNSPVVNIDSAFSHCKLSINVTNPNQLIESLWISVTYHASQRERKSRPNRFNANLTRRMAVANWICVSWVASLRPWNHRGKCYMDRKRIQCLSNASQHVPIYLQPFLRYSVISVASDWFSTYSWANERFLTTFCFPLGTPLGQSR